MTRQRAQARFRATFASRLGALTVVAVAVTLGLVLSDTVAHESDTKVGASANVAAHRVSAPDRRPPDASLPPDAHVAPAPTTTTTPPTLPPTTTSTTGPTRTTTTPDTSPIVSTIPSPVTPTTQSGNGAGSPLGSFALGSPPNAAAIAQDIGPTLVDITAVTANGSSVSGTGIVVTDAGEVLTNDHVVNGATNLVAQDVGNGQTFVADIVGTDEADDVAVLQLEGASQLQTAPMGDSGTVRLGDGVVAVGNANGAGGTPSYAAGAVTALSRHIVEQDNADGWDVALNGVMETNAAILPGDSGGALVDSGGEVIGIDTAILTTGTSGGFAIPINRVLQIAEEIENQAG